MEWVKKVEIITNTYELEEVLALLEKVDITAYIVTTNVTGREKGSKITDKLPSHPRINGYVMTVCTDKEEHELIEAIRPILEKYGGVCLVSDVKRVIH